MLSPDEALAAVLAVCERLPAVEWPPVEAAGLVLAEDIVADRDYPPFDRAMMDGYAVGAGCAGREVSVIGMLTAGRIWPWELPTDAALEIMTGAPCPSGTFAVAPYETAPRSGDRVRVPADLKPRANIAARGCECVQGRVVLRTGERLSALGAAVAAGVGRATVKVVRRPVVGVVTTGDELAAPGEPISAAQVRDSNGPMLCVMAAHAGARVAHAVRVHDHQEDLARALEAMGEVDVLVFTGGVSAGRFDGVRAALEAAGAEMLFHKVSQRPGKPLLAARRGSQLVFGLPGNPLACHLGFHRYVRAALRARMGLSPLPARARGVLARGIQVAGPRTVFQLVAADPREVVPRVVPLPGAGSADVFAPAAATAYLRIDVDRQTLAEGESVEIEWIGDAV